MSGVRDVNLPAQYCWIRLMHVKSGFSRSILRGLFHQSGEQEVFWGIFMYFVWCPDLRILKVFTYLKSISYRY